MRKKYLPFIGLAFLIILTGAFFSRSHIVSLFSEETKSPLNEKEQSPNTTPTQKIDSKKISSKIEELRKRYALRGLIYEGEAYLQNDQYGLALKQFSEALKQNPGSNFLLEKIADTYFEMNKYESAYSFYKKIQDPSEQIKDKTLTSLLYSKKDSLVSSHNDLLSEVKELTFNKEKTFYYTALFGCSVDFHNCKKEFQDYFAKNNTGSTFGPLKDMQETFKNYENFKLEDMYYKNALFLGSIFKQRFYPLVIQLGLSLNKEKPDYRPVIQMVAQSLYEIGEYKSAKTWLEFYIKLEPTDKDAWYMMGVINLKLGEYILSNIQLTKASDLGYKPTIQLKRRLAYNYFILQQQERMLSELASIVTTEEHYAKEDLYLALYYHIIHNQLDTATKLAELGNQKFPEDVNIYGYYGRIYKERGDLDSALQYTDTGLAKDPKNAFLLLNLGYIYLDKGIPIKARIYFSKVVKESPNSEFAKQAQSEIEKMTLSESQGKNQPK